MATTRLPAVYSPDPFAVTLTRLMRKPPITFRTLAARCSLSAGYLCRVASGERPAPPDDMIEAIAAAFPVDPVVFREYRLRRLAAALSADAALLDSTYQRVLGAT